MKECAQQGDPDPGVWERLRASEKLFLSLAPEGKRPTRPPLRGSGPQCPLGEICRLFNDNRCTYQWCCHARVQWLWRRPHGSCLFELSIADRKAPLCQQAYSRGSQLALLRGGTWLSRESCTAVDSALCCWVVLLGGTDNRSTSAGVTVVLQYYWWHSTLMSCMLDTWHTMDGDYNYDAPATGIILAHPRRHVPVHKRLAASGCLPPTGADVTPTRYRRRVLPPPLTRVGSQPGLPPWPELPKVHRRRPPLRLLGRIRLPYLPEIPPQHAICDETAIGGPGLFGQGVQLRPSSGALDPHRIPPGAH